MGVEQEFLTTIRKKKLVFGHASSPRTSTLTSKRESIRKRKEKKGREDREDAGWTLSKDGVENIWLNSHLWPELLHGMARER